MVVSAWCKRIKGEQSGEAKRRLRICMECQDKIRLTKSEYICSHCGCPIRTAVLANEKECSIGKW